MRVVMLFVLVMFAAAPAAFAQEDGSIFTVPRVPVFAEAESATAAQRIGQEQGRKVAMDLLLRRLTAEADWQYLPRLAQDQPAPAAAADSEETALLLGVDEVVERPSSFDPDYKRPIMIAPADLPRLELSFAPFEEKTSPTTYRANITYRFKPEAVRELLRQAQLPYSESQTRRALVLPVLQTETGLYLWESKNPWARAWLARPLVNELTPLVLPRGDQPDVETLTAEEARAFEPELLGQLADRYDVPQVIIALGRLTEDGDQFRLYVRLMDGYLDGRGSNQRRIDAANSAELYDDDGFGETGAMPDGEGRVISAGEPGRVLAEAFYRGPGDDFPALAQRAVESIVTRYAADWKERTLVDHSAVREFRLTAWFTGMEEWGEIRAALEGTPLVKRTKTGAFNRENAVIEVTAIGSERQFALALEQEGLTVWRGEQGYHVADADRAAEIQLREAPIAEEPEFEAGRAADRRRFFGLGRRLGGDEDDGIGGEGPEGARPIDAQSGVPGMRGGDDDLPDLPDDLFGAPEEGGAPARLEPADGDR